MSWLKKEAEAALSVLRDCKCKFDPEVRCFSCDVAIVEQVARAFAERALKAFVPDCSERYFNHSVYEQDRQEALAAADKDEP